MFLFHLGSPVSHWVNAKKLSFLLSCSAECAAEKAVCGVQQMLTADTAVLVETGDSWFNGQKMKLPEGCL